MVEMGTIPKESVCSLMVTTKVSISQVIDCKKFSNIERLLRVTYYVLCFINNSKKTQ